MWFRRDLRRHDNPALNDATTGLTEGVLPLFVVDPRLWNPAGNVRKAYLLDSLQALSDSLDRSLQIRRGDPVVEVPRAAKSVGAEKVFVAADFGPYGLPRDKAVEAALSRMGVELVRVGSPYAVAPGRVRKDDGSPYRVYTPYYRSWIQHGWRAPAARPDRARWLCPKFRSAWPARPPLNDVELPAVGEQAAARRWQRFVERALDSYATDRNRPDLAGSSRMSVHLKFGEIHPRTMLADLGETKAHEVFRRELAWREFYADVLYHRPDSAREYLRAEFAKMTYADPSSDSDVVEAWQQGRTGYPIVDAGMRQLLAEGWMHNRVRMIVASFLVKDLHIEWQVGARWFMQHLVDGDLASNSHGWQWTAGSGTDAAPYFRVFNPVTQGLKFDLDGQYVRRYVPELRHLDGRSVHEPWDSDNGYEHDYPRRIVDHAEERRVALDRYEAVKSS